MVSHHREEDRVVSGEASGVLSGVADEEEQQMPQHQCRRRMRTERNSRKDLNKSALTTKLTRNLSQTTPLCTSTMAISSFGLDGLSSVFTSLSSQNTRHGTRPMNLSAAAAGDDGDEFHDGRWTMDDGREGRPSPGVWRSGFGTCSSKTRLGS